MMLRIRLSLRTVKPRLRQWCAWTRDETTPWVLRLNLRSILVGGQMILTLIALIPAVAAVFLAERVIQQQEYTVAGVFPAITALDELRESTHELTQGMIVRALTPGEAHTDDSTSAPASFPALEDAWQREHGVLIANTCGPEIMSELDRLLDKMAEHEQVLARRPKFWMSADAKALAVEVSRIRDTEAMLESVAKAAIISIQQETGYQLAAVHDHLNLIFLMAVVVAVLVTGLALLLGLRLADSLHRGIDEVKHASVRIMDGDYYVRAKRPRLPVTAELIDAFNAMAERLESVFKKGKAEREAMAADLEQRIEAERRLEGEAQRDPLTRLCNRTVLLDRLERCIERKRREPQFDFAMLFLDLDRFKVINDSLGHHVGDHLLLEAARRLSRSVRKLDTVVRVDKEVTARLGGDEFAILLEGISNPSRAVLVAERIQAEFAEQFRLDGYEISVQTSIGIALGSKMHQSANDVLRDADTAMYRAKVAGGSQHAVFDDVMHREVKSRLHLENDLRKAVENQNFTVMYQPIIDLKAGNTVAFEALIRWMHPEKGVIGPERFISLAEETGLIVPIGRWMLRQSCRQLCAWRALLPKNHPLCISVNVSPRQVGDGDLVDEVERTLSETGLDAKYLRLEITESMIMDNANSINEVLGRLKALGVEIYMDDFGTGYSSLSCLHSFPIDVLKIDREFMLNLETNKNYASIVRAIMTLAKNLKLRVTVEGIETAQQIALVKKLGCHFGQGHYFSEPLDARGAWAFLTQGDEKKASA